MDSKHYLGYLIKNNHAATKKLIDDIGDEESLERGGQEVNHIRWLTGHIVNSLGSMVNILGGQSDLPQKYTELFMRGSQFNKDESAYPSMDELRSEFDRLYQEALKALEKVSVEELDTEREIYPRWNARPAEALFFLCSHEFYHAGQFATLRKILGRDRMFG